MVQFINPSTFQYMLANNGQNYNHAGYPNQWQPPHWTDNQYNPHIRVFINEPDGTRHYYDPTNQTHSYEHASGYHWGVLNDSVIENTPTTKRTYVGGGGHDHTVNGHHDFSTQGHNRQNSSGDIYENVKGVHHGFYGGGRVSQTMGNETHEHGGNVKHRVMGKNAGYGVGVGEGDGQYHDNSHTMTNMRHYHMAHTMGDHVTQTNANTISHASGKDIRMSANTDVQSSANNGMHVTHGQQGNYMESSQGDVHLKSDNGTIWLNAPGQVVNINASGLNVMGAVNAASFNVSSSGGNAPNIPAMPQNPQSPSSESGQQNS